MKKTVLSVLSVCFLTVALPPIAGAKSVTSAPYQGYEYNDYGESAAAPVGYAPCAVYDSGALGLTQAMATPADMCYDGKEFLYVLDSGNGRILQFGRDMKAAKIYDAFTGGDGGEKSIQGAQGFTLDGQGGFYVANTEENEVLHINAQGTVVQVITRPDAALLDTDAVFKATKVALDRKNKLYVLVESVNLGAFVFNEAGEFEQFFGSNPIKKTAEVIGDYFWKRFMTQEQRKGLKRVTPTIFNNFDVDEYGFLYTVTAMKENVAQPESVRRLNYQGDNILKEDLVFGDLEWDRAVGAEGAFTSFIDVDIDSQGFINLLDNGRGRVFQYTTQGELVAAFGTFGDQKGGFSEPVALETIGERVYVLDAMKNCIVVFQPSPYGANLRSAFLSMKYGDAEKSLDIWQAVLRQNTNSQYPYYGIGMVYDARGRYQEAMRYFKLAGAHEEYSKSFREYRKDFINQYYWILILGVLAGGTGLVLLLRLVKRKMTQTHGTAYSVMERKYTFPLYTALHPADGFDQFKGRKIGSYRLAGLLMLAWFAVKTLDFFCSGYIFNANRPIDYQFLVMLFVSVGVLLLFIVANWSVCTLFSGKGTLKDIACTCSYALLPYLVAQLINVGLSNMLALEEKTFMQLVLIIGVLWSLLILIIGLQSIHQYSFLQTIGSILLTLVGIAVMLFLFVLFYTLLQQTINFIRSLITEISLR